MSKALYRKYRSRKLSEIVGQEHITQTLDNAIKTDKISHAYLFTGPRGVGKTSIARILAHEINELPYSDESIHLDIIEIDAASNRRIDEIRDLRDKVHIAPTSAKYKVYIIDEVHMLTREAFNALLKTLEEPPKHVIFILATTEIHKLPETIISRTQRFTFKSIDEQAAVKHLAEIAKSEGIEIDKEALSLLAVHGGGSFRDSISLLDQVGSAGRKISKKEVEQLIGIAANDHIDKLLQSTLSGQPADIADSLEDIIEDGTGAVQVAKQVAAKLRAQIIAGQSSEATLGLLTDLLAVSASPEPASSLEVALFKANLKINPGTQVQSQSVIEVEAAKQTPNKTPEPAVTTPAPTAEPSTKKPDPKKVEKVAEEAPAAETIEEETAIENITGELADWWDEVLNHIKKTNNTLYGILRMAEAKVDKDNLNLVFGFAFHKNKVSDPPTQAKINEAVEKVTGQAYKIQAILNKGGTTAPKPAATNKPETEAKQTEAADNKDLDSITNVFGGGEVLES